MRVEGEEGTEAIRTFWFGAYFCRGSCYPVWVEEE